jgi:hypothetical protein
MKKRFAIFLNPRSKLLLSLLCALPFCGIGQSKTNPPAAAPVSTNAVISTQAVFIQPKDPSEGRDPFYPRSTYPYLRDSVVIAPTNTVAPPTVQVDLKLKGISGLPPRRLAVINNHTFEAGEEAEVSTTNGRMNIRCLEISENTATVQVGPERRVLRMRNY